MQRSPDPRETIMKRLLPFALLLALAPAAARAGPVVVTTDLSFGITKPPGTTITGFELVYSAPSILDLTPSAPDPGLTLATDGISRVTGTFAIPVTTAAGLEWTFLTSPGPSIVDLDIRLLGASGPVTGVDAHVIVTSSVIAEPPAVLLLGAGAAGSLWFLRRKG